MPMTPEEWYRWKREFFGPPNVNGPTVPPPTEAQQGPAEPVVILHNGTPYRFRERVPTLVIDTEGYEKKP